MTSRRALVVVCGLGIAAPLVGGTSGCTEPNPAHLEEPGDDIGPLFRDGAIVADGPLAAGDGAPPRPDGRAAFDGPAPADLSLPADTTQPPDQTAAECKIDADCDDGLACTENKCKGKQCHNTLLPGFCLIGGLCYLAGQANPANSCEACVPATNAISWTTAGDGTPCAPDPWTCTLDRCKTGYCEHTLEPGSCLIDGVCYADGDAGPASCQVCDAATNSWVVAPDGTPCEPDGLWCTAETCQAGVCLSAPAGGCLIDGVCRQNGATPPKDSCNECVVAVETSAWTFVTGKPCPTGTGLAPICFAGGCKGWTESLFSAPGTVGSTALNAVDYIPPAKAVWAAGEFVEASLPTNKGLLLELGGSGAAGPIVAQAPLRDLHFRVAVGDDGQAYYHNGIAWTQPPALIAAVGGVDRYAVWAASVGGFDVAFLSGNHNLGTGEAGVLRCSNQGGAFACAAHGGFSNGALLGALFGAVTATGTPGPVWAAQTDAPASEPEDIYFYPGTGTTWTVNAPEGCEDTGNTSPCANTNGALLDMNGSGAGDLWVVGSYGNLLHFDGAKWNRLTGVFTGQATYTLQTVFSSPSDGLVLIAGYRNEATGRSVVLFTHNTELNRWFGPIELSWSTTWSDEIRDIGGQGFDDLWMVGRRTSLSSSNPGLAGWILHF